MKKLLEFFRSTPALIGAVLLAMPAAVFAHGGFDERIARILVALESRPEDAALHFQLADVRYQHDEWRAALNELDQVDRLAPGKYWTDLLRGQALLAGKMPEEAKRALDRFIATHPAETTALTFRARANEALKDAVACLADYETAWRSTERPEPDLVQEYSNTLVAYGRQEESLRVLQSGIEKIGAVPGLVQLALEREIALGRFDAAITRIEAVQKSAPRPEPWMAKRASLLARAGHTAAARKAWQALIDHLAALPNLERGSHAMSVLAEQARNELAALPAASAAAAPPKPVSNQVAVKPDSVYEEELIRANEQVAAAPGEGKAWYERAVLLLRDREYVAAISDAEQTERLAPGKFFTQWVRGQALAEQGQVEQGRAVLDDFLAAHPEHAAGFAARARVWSKLDRSDQALADYRATLRVSGESDVALVIEAVDALVAGGFRDEAVQALSTTLRRLGPVPTLRQRVLELETATGRFDAALVHLDELQKSAPRPEPWMAKRAALLVQAGRVPEACAAWQALLTRISALPNLERGSPAMARLAAQAQQALTALPCPSGLSTPPRSAPQP